LAFRRNFGLRKRGVAEGEKNFCRVERLGGVVGKEGVRKGQRACLEGASWSSEEKAWGGGREGGTSSGDAEVGWLWEKGIAGS